MKPLIITGSFEEVERFVVEARRRSARAGYVVIGESERFLEPQPVGEVDPQALRQRTLWIRER